MSRPTSRRVVKMRETVAISSTRQVAQRGEVVEKVEHTDKVEVDLNDIRNPAYITLKGGITRNTGNFESVRVDVSISFPCQPTMDAVEDTYGLVSRKLDELISREENAALGIEEGATDQELPII